MTIQNTAKVGVHPEWIRGGDPEMIERQEAKGQQELAADTALPIEGLDTLPAEWGIRTIAVRPNDPLFVTVALPEGWRIVPTNHAMWSKLVDAAGVERASIFYKAAFYDRHAFIRPCQAR